MLSLYSLRPVVSFWYLWLVLSLHYLHTETHRVSLTVLDAHSASPCRKSPIASEKTKCGANQWELIQRRVMSFAGYLPFSSTNNPHAPTTSRI